MAHGHFLCGPVLYYASVTQMDIHDGWMRVRWGIFSGIQLSNSSALLLTAGGRVYPKRPMVQSMYSLELLGATSVIFHATGLKVDP